MLTLTREQSLLVGVTPPPEGEIPLPTKPVTKRLKKSPYLYRRQEVLSNSKKEEIKKLLYNVYREWEQNTPLLRSKLRKANDLMEGIKEPKDFPWVDSSNLHMPLIEIHITILHSVVSSTMLDNDPIWYVRIQRDGVPEGVDAEIEAFLNAVCKLEFKIDSVLSDIYWAVYRDGTAIGDLDWVEEYDVQYDILRFSDPEKFISAFPTPESAGVSLEQYNKYIADILSEGEISIKVEEYIATYRGPRLRQVELKDFVMVPTTSPTIDYAMFVGDMFLARGDFFRRKVKQKWFDEIEVKSMLAKEGLNNAPDEGSRAQDNIEGIARNRLTRADEYWCMQGILKINLSDDDMEPERKYLVTFHPESKALMRFECYPYLHNRSKYIPWRFKKRPNRFNGQSIYDQLGDINDEMDTQHNQRVDSRTISTVPSFLKVDSFEFDPTRRNQRFFPGCTFKVSNFNQVKQFEIKQTDMGQSMQEEQNLMYIAELRTGASAAKSGREVAKDPRASGKKLQAQIAQADMRVDDHMRELRIGTAEVGLQVLELFYQYAPEMITYFRRDPNTLKFVQGQIVRQKLRARDLYLEVARTSMADNPGQLLQREMTIYQLLSNEPLIGGNMIRRRELLVRVLIAMRERNIDKIIPPIEQMLQELQQQSKLTDEGSPPTHQALGLNLAGVQGKEQKNKGGAAAKKPLDTSNSTNPVGS